MKNWLTFPLILVFFGAIDAQSTGVIPPNIDLDSYYGYSEKDEKGRLDSFLLDLSNSQNGGVISLKFKDSRSRNERIKRIRRILKHVRFRKFDVKRLSFRISEGPADVLILFDDSIPFKGLTEADEKHLVVSASEIEGKLKTIFPHSK